MLADKAVQKLYDEAISALQPSDDDRLEKLKWRIVRAELPDTEATPLSIKSIAGSDEAWSRHAFFQLGSSGFIHHQEASFAWTTFDGNSLSQDYDMLAAIEAIVSVRCEFLDLSPIMHTLEMRAALLSDFAGRRDALNVCFNVQHFFLTLVAAMQAAELFREYTAFAKPSLAYASCSRIRSESFQQITETANTLVNQLKVNDGIGAARAITSLRSLQAPRTRFTISSIPLAH